MARITKSVGGTWIDSGPITATHKLNDVPQENWYNLMCQRQMFVKAQLPHDCRCLIQFVEDAERMYAPLGFKDADDFIARGLKLAPEEIRIAVDWLKINKPEEAIPIDVVQRLAKPGRPWNKPCNTKFKYGTAGHWLARLDRDGFTDLAAQVRAGTKSANAAACEAGFRKPPKHKCPNCGHEWWE